MKNKIKHNNSRTFLVDDVWPPKPESKVLRLRKIVTVVNNNDGYNGWNLLQWSATVIFLFGSL